MDEPLPQIYVTGASGVLGSELAGFFARSCADRSVRDVIAVSRRRCPALADDHPGHRRVATIFDARWLDPAAKDATILHCAGLSDPRTRFRNFAVLAREHILPHVDMVEAMLDRGWRGRLVFFSSGGTIYGDTRDLPIRETHPTNPTGFYGLHKLCLERALAQLARERGFELVILRISNPYGSLRSKPGQGVIPILIDAFLNDRLFRIIGDGSAERDYIEIRDLCAAVERAISVALPDPTLILNIGSGRRTSLNRLIAILGDFLGRELRTTMQPDPNAVHANALSCERAREVLGWQAKIPLETGLKELLERKNADPELP